MITIYQKPTCTTCRQVYAALKESGADILRKKEAVYENLGLAEKKLSDEALLDLMAKHPDLIQRPIVEKGNKAILARPAERIKEIL